MQKRDYALIISIILLALNLRPVMASLGPILDLIKQDISMSAAAAGLLTTLPVLMIGVGCYTQQRLKTLLGVHNGITLGIIIVMVSCAMRAVWVSMTGMLATAVLAGIGIAMIQVLLPGLVRQRFGTKTGAVMALYTTGIMGGSALASASAARLAEQFGWVAALVLNAVPALIAASLWLWVNHQAEPVKDSQTVEKSYAIGAFWTNKRAWLLMLFFGISTSSYTLVLAWLPPYYVDLGESRQFSGDLLAILTITEVFAGLVVAVLVTRFQDRRVLLMPVLLFILAGLILLMTVPVSFAVCAAILLGIGIGAVFPLSLIVTMDHAHHPDMAGALAAFVQGGGYIIASLMPFAAGMIRDYFMDLTQAWGVMAVGVVIMMLLAMRLSPANYQKIHMQ